MLIDIKSISHSKGASMAIEVEKSPDELPFSSLAYRLTRPLSFSGTLTNTGDGILTLTGRIQTAFSGECARCLAPVTCDLNLSLSESYQAAATLATAADEPDAESYRYAGSQLDLSQAIRDNLVLALPQRLLCREDCLGLCPDCGNNLNEKNCGCAAAREGKASPFDQLKQLL